jgi:hypothetical protein
MQNETLQIIKDINSKIGPVIQNPSSLFGSGSVKLIYGFFDNILNQLSSSKEVKAEVGFDSFTPDELGILPYGYNVVILGPENENITSAKFKILVDSDKNLKLFDDGKLYDKYPYIIILLGLSNYIDIPGTPSKFYAQNKSCALTEKDYTNLLASLEISKDKLSDEQMAAEKHLLQLFSYKLKIETGVASNDESKLLIAYNSLYDFKKDKLFSLNDSLYFQHFKPMYDLYNGCIEVSASSLGLYKLLIALFPVLDKDPEKITNSDLEILKTYVETTKTLNFIPNSKFNSTAITTQILAENKIYSSKFKDVINSILNQDDFTESVKEDVKKLINLKNEFDQCSRCIEEAQKAEKHYGDLVKTDIEKRRKMTEIVTKSNETLQNGGTIIQLIELSESKLDSITRSPLIALPIKKDDVTSLLQAIKLNKEALNNKLALVTFSKKDNSEIDGILNTLNELLISFNTNISSTLKPILDTNNKILTFTPSIENKKII